MKKRKSKNYLVIGNVHLGTNEDMLKALELVATTYDAKVLHTGNICTYTEKAMHRRRIRRLRTFEHIGQEKHQAQVSKLRTEIKHVEKDLIDHKPFAKRTKAINTRLKQIKEQLTKYAEQKTSSKDPYDARVRTKIQKLKSESAKLKQELKSHTLVVNKNLRLLEKKETLYGKIDLLEEINDNKRKLLEDEVHLIQDAEHLRIDTLKQYFPGIKLIANDEQYINSHKEIIGDHYQICKHLDVESVNANGDRVTSTPITDRAFRYLKQKRKSVITPHPAPSLRSYEREGLNEAWNMYTTGCLYDVNEAKRPSEFYKATYMPSALLVTVDTKTGEFHAARLHFDKIRCDFAHRTKPAILHDGRCFTAGGVVDVTGADIAIYSTDCHCPWENLGVLAAHNALCVLSEAETIVDGGDVGDWTSLCPHNKNKPRSAENLRFADDKRAVKRFMEAKASASEHIKEKILIDANHEYWLERYVDEHPAMEGIVDQASVYAEIIPDWEYHIPKNGEDYTYYFGDLAIRHGHKENLSKATKLFPKYLGGHFHSHNEYLRCGSSGAGANLGPKYLEGNLTKWQNCVTSITRYKGVTSFDIKSVLHDKSSKKSRFAWQGQIFEVPHHKYSDS